MSLGRSPRNALLGSALGRDQPWLGDSTHGLQRAICCMMLWDKLTSSSMDFSQFHLVAIEVPSTSKRNFEHELAVLVGRVRSQGPHVNIITTETVKRKNMPTWWAHRWNRMKEKPFELAKMCTCDLHSSCASHLSLFVGSSVGELVAQKRRERSWARLGYPS